MYSCQFYPQTHRSVCEVPHMDEEFLIIFKVARARFEYDTLQCTTTYRVRIVDFNDCAFSV